METQRQKRIAGIIQSDIADVLRRALADSGFRNLVVSVTQVKVTVDLTLAKVYLSVFPTNHVSDFMKEVELSKSAIRHELARRTKDQLRRMPELAFYLDDSLDYIDQIERSLKGSDNPIENPDLLQKRKKK